MVGASKILTVSYGTFSCTLEGFDDPFSTMRAIAEYFRDLAANDRFFGAEPPTPDVQMLHSIAQQNSEAPVDAKVEEGGLRLTQADTPKKDADKPRHKKKRKNKNKKKKRKARRAATFASVAILTDATAQEVDTQDNPIEPVETEVEDIAAEVEDAPASAFEMFLDDDTSSNADPAIDEDVEAVDTEETQDNALSALLADEAALTEEETPETSDVDEAVLPEIIDENLAEDADTVPEILEVTADLEEVAETEVVDVDRLVNADFAEAETDHGEDPIAKHDAESHEFASGDEIEDITDETSETVVAIDFAEDAEEASEEDTPDFTPVPAVNRFAPVEQTVAEIEGLVSIEPTADPIDSVAFDDSTEAGDDSDQEITESEGEPAGMSSDEFEGDDQHADSNVTAFTPIEPAVSDEATAENMFTEEVDVEQNESADFDNDVAALFAVDEGQDDDTEVTEHDDVAHSDDLHEVEEDESASKRGLLSAASIAAKLQRIRAVVTSSVGGGDSTLASGETTDEDALEDDSETTPEAAWDETTEQSEETADWAETAGTEVEEVAEVTDSDAFAADGQRGPMPIEVSDDDLAAAAAISSSVGSHRPEVFKQTLESLNRDEPSSLSEEDEADLISQLAEASEFAEENSKDGRAILEGDAIEKEEEALERLLEQTNTRLNEDTTQRRQSALSHLKAAVAATIADRNEAQTPVEQDPNKDADSDYRNDLADIVRPKRVTKEERATKSTVAPLVLVPQAKVEDDEQDETTEAAEPVSIDVPEGGVRPRRISRDEMAATNADLDTGFSDYAEQVGANDLNELLEAAAAYLNKVEGKPHFSRPQVMHIVMRHDPERSFSREDSLRSFGELLRNGAIEKVDRGQFVISNESKFLAAS